MAMRKLLILLKPFDVYAPPHGASPQILHHLDSRRKVHLDTIKFCQTILQKKPVEWKAIERNDLSQPINDVDLVVTVGGDGTLLQASHFMDDRIPILGVNSDPTRNDEVERFRNEFDATRSTGHLCAATVENFEQVLNGILESQTVPSKLKRISISVNTRQLPTYALNDILVANPCPAALSAFSFRIRKDDQPCSPLAICRSSGLRVSTAAGSTAAMHSAGGFLMPILSQDLQYMVREPISPGPLLNLMRGVIKHDQAMDITWSCREGVIYIDGYHVKYTIQDGDKIEISCRAPILKVFLPNHLLTSAL
ncbi:NADH kinase-like isoform X1 [Neltuma alba]|uniref:NADH kinase-like isoform X1 n=1 Tax=Neltuma alba TaxID=207710 RepID=UPI0010A38AFF|nr:NADH kinase-like isoform X1 [Prosopis alba]